MSPNRALALFASKIRRDAFTLGELLRKSFYFLFAQHVANASIPVYSKTLVVPETAIDENGHVNNVAYVQWMQEIAV